MARRTTAQAAEAYTIDWADLLQKVKANLIIAYDDDDTLIDQMIKSAVEYAERFQHRAAGYYSTNAMPVTTERAVIMLSSSMYESRDGSTGGYFGDSVPAGAAVWKAVNNLLRMSREAWI